MKIRKLPESCLADLMSNDVAMHDGQLTHVVMQQQCAAFETASLRSMALQVGCRNSGVRVYDCQYNFLWALPFRDLFLSAGIN